LELKQVAVITKVKKQLDTLVAAKKEKWITGAQARVRREREEHPTLRLEEGEQFLLFGKPCTLRLRGGGVETLKFWGITVDVKRMDKVEIPAYKGTRPFEYAKPEEGGVQ